MQHRYDGKPVTDLYVGRGNFRVHLQLIRGVVDSPPLLLLPELLEQLSSRLTLATPLVSLNYLHRLNITQGLIASGWLRFFLRFRGCDRSQVLRRILGLGLELVAHALCILREKIEVRHFLPFVDERVLVCGRGIPALSLMLPRFLLR